MVVDDKEVLEKPVDAEDAKKTLKRLSGKTHVVKTSHLLLTPTSSKTTKYDVIHEITETKVTFRVLEDEFIRDYVASGHPMDKAGSYGYMEEGAALVSKIEGDYFNVIGFSAATFADLIKQIYP